MIGDESAQASTLRHLRTDGGWFEIAGKARLAVTGADRLRYLNGQVSNDLRKLTTGHAMSACILSAKGKLDGVVLVWMEEKHFVVECEADLADLIQVRLERYVVADDVEITPIESAKERHVFGKAADQFSNQRIASRLGVAGVDVPGTMPGIDFEAIKEASPAMIELLQIERQLPRWGHELGPDTLPVEAGLDRSAVDFHKGCYIGQEVVSRLRSVGHANRSLHSFETNETKLPKLGEAVFLSEAPDKPVGTITSAAPHFELSAGAGLCYIKRGIDPASPLMTATTAIQIPLRLFPCE